MPRAIDLRRVAEWAGTTVDEIQALNPELRRWTTPVKYPDYEVKVPAGTRRPPERAPRRSARRPTSPRSSGTRSKRGETLLTVSRKFGVSRAGRRRSEQPHGQGASASRAGTDHSARAGDAAGGAHRARGADGGRVAVACLVRGGSRQAATAAQRRRRSPTASSAATRCSRSRSCSTRPSRRSRAGTACTGNTIAPGAQLEDPRQRRPLIARWPVRPPHRRIR